MSDEVLAFLITLAIVVTMFLWIPTLDLCNEGCQRLFFRRTNRECSLASGCDEPGEAELLAVASGRTE